MGTDKAAGSPEPRRLGAAGAAWRAGMPGPMCSICDRGMPAMAAARVGFAAADAVGVPSLSLPRPGRSAVRGLAVAGGILGVCIDTFLSLLLDSMYFSHNMLAQQNTRGVQRGAASKVGPIKRLLAWPGMIALLTPVVEMCGLELWCGLVTWRGEPCLAMACMSISGRTGSPGKADSARMAASICARFTADGGACTLTAGGGTEAGGGFCTAPAAGLSHPNIHLGHACRSLTRVRSTAESGMCTHAGISNAAGSNLHVAYHYMLQSVAHAKDMHLCAHHI